MQWNAGGEAGGYCGIQEHPDGRNFIFSIWDPISTNEKITAAYKHPYTKVENFGGEGTGLKSWNFGIDWETDQWYSFVSRAWNLNSHTMFGYWVYDHASSVWYHLVTMDFPVSGVKFNTGTGSFIEDWIGSGWNTREVHHKDGWKRKTSDHSWYAFSSSYFERVYPDDGAANYINNYDGGVIDNYFFMKSGGNDVSPITNESGTTLYINNYQPSPSFEKGNISTLTINTKNDTTLSVAWEVDSTKAPQFSYHINIYDNPEYSGEPVIEKSENIPHLRYTEIDLNGLRGDTLYYVELYINDIFDNLSVAKKDTFRTDPKLAVRKHKFNFNINVFPNPFSDKLNITSEKILDNVTVQLISLTGEIVKERTLNAVTQLSLHTGNIPDGTYLLRVLTSEGYKTLKLSKRSK
jgi:hypothetical protein